MNLPTLALRNSRSSPCTGHTCRLYRFRKSEPWPKRLDQKFKFADKINSFQLQLLSHSNGIKYQTQDSGALIHTLKHYHFTLCNTADF